MPDMDDLNRRPFDGEEDAPANASPEEHVPHVAIERRALRRDRWQGLEAEDSLPDFVEPRLGVAGTLP